MKHSPLIIYFILSLFLVVLHSSESVGSVSCGKDRTADEFIAMNKQNPEQSGVLGITVIKKVNKDLKEIVSETYYIDGIKYKDALIVGDKFDAFFWVPHSSMSLRDILSEKSAVKMRRCCSSRNGCSRCCDKGACICLDFDNGGCSCSNC